MNHYPYDPHNPHNTYNPYDSHETHSSHYPHDNHADEERQFNLPGFLFGQIFGPGQQQGPPPFGPPGFPSGPGGFPGGPGGFPGGPPGGPPGQQQQSGPPTSPPPSFTPQQAQFQTFAVDPGGIRGCLFRYTYIWLRRDAFWFFPTFVGRNSVAGWRWRQNRWVYFGIDLNQIQSFQCF